ncbi:MAG: hypothetical protein QM820_63455 [Minicystis sp.]
MAARSIDGTIVNNTSRRMIRTSANRESGKYTNEPPGEIAPRAQASFRIESNGFMTGAIGSVTYRFEGVSGMVDLHYSNPYIGSNHYENSAPAGYSVDRAGGDGDNTSITLTINGP